MIALSLCAEMDSYPVSGSQESGVAYAAHIGGFVAGVLLAKPFVIGRPEANDAGWFPAR
jgi:membrane associated rhomboid family serine protease